MALSLTTGPASEPISLTEAKAQLRLEISADDDLVTDLIQGAREAVEDITKRQLITATWKLTLDAFPAEIVLPLPPLQSVSSIKYYDTDGNQQTLSSSLYSVDTQSQPGRITPAYGESWPDTRTINNAVEVNFVAGYGDAGSDVPMKIRQAMLLYITWGYEDREAMKMKPRAIDDLLSHYIASIYI